MAATTTTKAAQPRDRSLIIAVRDELSRRFPQYKNHITAAAPYFSKAADLLDIAYPYLVQSARAVRRFYDVAKENHWDVYAPLVIGLVLCFFGGTYLTLVAAFEAVRLSVWKRLSTSLLLLRDNYARAAEASRKDDEVDADGNGVADVKEITSKQLLSRKVAVFMRSADPEQVSGAVANVWGALLIVVATVKTQFAQALTLGASLGEALDNRFHEPLEQFTRSALPNDQKKWASIVVTWSFKIMGSFIALFVKRLIVAFHASIRGAMMFTTTALTLAQERGLVSLDMTASSKQIMVISSFIAFWGFYWQLTHAFGLPFPLNVVFLPITIVEWALEVVIAVL